MRMKRPGVGLGLIVIRSSYFVLLGKRKNTHGQGTWCFPGGHLEKNESFDECVLRELREECGKNLKIKLLDSYPIAATNDVFEKEKKHYVTLYMRSEYVSGEAEVMEPDKCDGWNWFKWYEMPRNLFLPIKNLKRQGYDPVK
jgi:8-oxo-dGTP diphosphatase